jgi:hypothetical protein
MNDEDSRVDQSEHSDKYCPMGLNERTAVLEADSRNTRDLIKHVEERLLNAIADLKTVMVERVGAVEVALFRGNGRPSFQDRLAEVERQLSNASTVKVESDRTWSRVAPVITPLVQYLLAALAAILVYLAGKGKLG